MMILSSSKRGNTIAATKQQKNIRKDVNLTGFFKSFKRALGLFTHNGAKISNRLPTIKNMIDKVNKLTIPRANTMTPTKIVA